MAKAPQKPADAAAQADADADAAQADPLVCGIVMPISTTGDRDASHFARVQQLLHRSVKAAGMEPRNVWVGSSADKITDRILQNLFLSPIIVCDISQLNPNVMLELGMRLSSKKPTVVVGEEGGAIPFDIKDFDRLGYPADLNILDMEAFMERLTQRLRDQWKAVTEQTYRPFLSNVDFEIFEPEVRETPFEDLVANRLDSILNRLDRVESRQRSVKGNTGVAALAEKYAALVPDTLNPLLSVDPDLAKEIAGPISRMRGVGSVTHVRGEDGEYFLRLNLEGRDNVRVKDLKVAAMEVAQAFDPGAAWA